MRELHPYECDHFTTLVLSRGWIFAYGRCALCGASARLGFLWRYNDRGKATKRFMEKTS